MAISKIILNGVTQMDVTQDTVASTNLLSGYTATKNDGTKVSGSYVPPSAPTLQTKSVSYTPTESAQSGTVTADSGYDGLDEVNVTVGAISSTYVGTGITRRSSTDLTRDAYTINVPAGYYAENASRTVERTVHATPTVSINEATGLITAKHTQNQGWVEGSGSGADSTVKTLQLSTQAAKTITPTESSQTAVAANVYTIGAVIVDAISSTYVGSSITQCDSDDLTVSGATVTAPAGYYSAAASKSVTTMTLPSTLQIAPTTGFTKILTIDRQTSTRYINIREGYNSTASYYEIAAVPDGSATGPTSLSGSSATITTRTNTITLTKTNVTTTPTVSAGYVSSATASTATVTLTASVTTKAATTYHPSTTAHSISSGTYLTGAQTIAAVTTSNLSASNIVSGVTIKVGDSSDDDCVASVTGNVVLQNYYTGSSAPSSSTGSNGDLYLQS